MSYTRYLQLTGRTFPHRDAIVLAGGRFNNVYKTWSVPEGQWERLDALVNPVVAVPDREPVRPSYFTVGPVGDERVVAGIPDGFSEISSGGAVHNWTTGDHAASVTAFDAVQVAAHYSRHCDSRIRIFHRHTKESWAASGQPGARPWFVGNWWQFPGKPEFCKAFAPINATMHGNADYDAALDALNYAYAIAREDQAA